jgi:hypothetical protein
LVRLQGSGGYALAKLTEQEEIKGSLRVRRIFLGNIGRLNEDKITSFNYLLHIKNDIFILRDMK